MPGAPAARTGEGRPTQRVARVAGVRQVHLQFLDYADVLFENNFAERQIRPALILRKNGQSNRSDRGAATRAILMSVCRTLQLRGLHPTKTVGDAPQTYLTTGQLPRLPDADIAGG